ncbi:MAG: hypothetical protein IJ545_02145 [Alphaproteobacteria bacterium]|nr:hypothetical protein [Alphaproteobacteria bacterium]
MEKKVISIFRTLINFICFSFICLGGMIIVEFHKIKPFFPILFLFDFCLLIGYPLFLRFILNRKWFECAKDGNLRLKYLFIPYIVLESLVMLYYPNEIVFALQQIVKG